MQACAAETARPPRRPRPAAQPGIKGSSHAGWKRHGPDQVKLQHQQAQIAARQAQPASLPRRGAEPDGQRRHPGETPALGWSGSARGRAARTNPPRAVTRWRVPARPAPKSGAAAPRASHKQVGAARVFRNDQPRSAKSEAPQRGPPRHSMPHSASPAESESQSAGTTRRPCAIATEAQARFAGPGAAATRVKAAAMAARPARSVMSGRRPSRRASGRWRPPARRTPPRRSGNARYSAPPPRAGPRPG